MSNRRKRLYEEEPHSNRFAGDASLYGGVDLKVILARMRSLIPGDFGFDVFAEAGRVYLEGRDTDVWHPSYGLGLFYAPFARTSLYGLKFGRTDNKEFFVVLEARMVGFGS